MSTLKENDIRALPNWRTIVVLFAVVAAAGAYLETVSKWFVETTGAKAIHDADFHTFFWTPAQWRDVLMKLGPDGRRFLTFVWLVPDLLVPVCFGLGLTFLTQKVARSRPWWSWTALFYTASDISEGAIGILLMGGYFDGPGQLNLFEFLVYWRNWVKLAKTTLIACSFLFLILAIVRRCVFARS